MSRLLSALLLVLSLPAALAAADVTGSWSLDFNPDLNGEVSSGKCTFTQDGTRLTGTCDGGAQVNGEVNGTSVSWKIQTGEAKDTTVFFTATIDDKAARMTEGSCMLFVPNGRTLEGKFEARKE